MSSEVILSLTQETCVWYQYPWRWPGILTCRIKQESPVPGLKEEVSGGQVSEASSVFTAAPHLLHYHPERRPHQINSGIRFHRSFNPNPKVKAEYPGVSHKLKYRKRTVIQCRDHPGHPSPTPALVHGKTVCETSPWCQRLRTAGVKHQPLHSSWQRWKNGNKQSELFQFGYEEKGQAELVALMEENLSMSKYWWEGANRGKDWIWDRGVMEGNTSLFLYL